MSEKRQTNSTYRKKDHYLLVKRCGQLVIIIVLLIYCSILVIYASGNHLLDIF